MAALAIGFAICRLIGREAMDALVLAGEWTTGTEAVREQVASDLGNAYVDAAWERGRVEAWTIYSDRVGRTIAWTQPVKE
jgi:hypothetical protein